MMYCASASRVPVFPSGGFPGRASHGGTAAPPIGAPVLPRFHMCGARRPAFQHFLRGWIRRPRFRVPRFFDIVNPLFLGPRVVDLVFFRSAAPRFRASASRARANRATPTPRISGTKGCVRVLPAHTPFEQAVSRRLDTASRSLGRRYDATPGSAASITSSMVRT